MPNLCVSRKCGESVIIGTGPNAVKVMVIQTWRGRVRLAIEAPAGIQVDRSEVRAEKLEAARKRAEEGT